MPGAVPLTHATKKSPGVIAGAWRAKDGSAGIVLASILGHEVSVELDLKPYGVSRSKAVFVIDEGGRRELERSGSSTSVGLRLEPRGACIVEVGK